MLDNHEALNGVSTTAYVGRQHQAQALAAAVQEKARILTRTYQRDNRLLWAVAVLTTLVLLSGAGNLWQGRTGVEQVPYVVLVDHLGNHAPLLKLAEQPVTPEQSIIIGTLMMWLEHVRMISSDSVVLGKNWARVEDFTSTAALATARRLSPGTESSGNSSGGGWRSVPRACCPSRNPAPIPPSGKRRPTITMASCSPRNRGGGRPRWSLPIFSPRWPSKNGTSVASNGTIATCWGLWWMNISWQRRPLLSQPQPPPEG